MAQFGTKRALNFSIYNKQLDPALGLSKKRLNPCSYCTVSVNVATG